MDGGNLGMHLNQGRTGPQLVADLPRLKGSMRQDFAGACPGRCMPKHYRLAQNGQSYLDPNALSCDWNMQLTFHSLLRAILTCNASTGDLRVVDMQLVFHEGIVERNKYQLCLKGNCT